MYAANEIGAVPLTAPTRRPEGHPAVERRIEGAEESTDSRVAADQHAFPQDHAVVTLVRGSASQLSKILSELTHEPPQTVQSGRVIDVYG
jgi:hypothetical protein